MFGACHPSCKNDFQIPLNQNHDKYEMLATTSTKQNVALYSVTFG